MQQPPKRRRYGLRFLFAQMTIVAIGVRVGLDFPKFADAMCLLYLWTILLQLTGVFKYAPAVFLHLGTMLITIVLRFAPCYTDEIVDCWIAPYLLAEAAFVGLVLSSVYLFIAAIWRRLV